METGKKVATERTVDVKALAGTVWDKRSFILKVIGVFIIVGILIILLSPVEYKVEATLLPETQAIPISGLLQQFGGILGLGGAMQNQNENLPPQLYPKIVNSLPYQVQLLNKEVTFARYDTTVPVYTFWSEVYTPSVLSYIKAYTVGLPGKIVKLFSEDKSPPSLPESVAKDSIISLGRYQLSIITAMRKHINLDINDENGLITLTVSMPDARAAAETGQLAIELLKMFVTEYRTEKAAQYLQFVEEQAQQAREEFHEIQAKLAVFRDQNINLVTAKALMQLKRLESKYDLLFNKYNSLEQQLQQAKLKVQKKTPVLTVIQPIKVPVDKYKPSPKFILILALVAGLVLSIFYIVARSIYEERKSLA